MHILYALYCDVQVYAKFIVMLLKLVQIPNSKIVNELSNYWNTIYDLITISFKQIFYSHKNITFLFREYIINIRYVAGRGRYGCWFECCYYYSKFSVRLCLSLFFVVVKNSNFTRLKNKIMTNNFFFKILCKLRVYILRSPIQKIHMFKTVMLTIPPVFLQFGGKLYVCLRENRKTCQIKYRL